MHPAISKSYIVPAVFLNPVIFLLILNTILSRVLPPVTVDAAEQPLPYSFFGPSAEHPHLNIHASEKLYWSYTVLIVCVQLAAFGRVSECREESKAKARMKREHVLAKSGACKDDGNVDCLNGSCYAIRVIEIEDHEDGSFGTDPRLWNLDASGLHQDQRFIDHIQTFFKGFAPKHGIPECEEN